MSVMKQYVFGSSPLGPSRRVKAAIRKAAKDINAESDDARERLMRTLSSKFGIGKEHLLIAGSRRELLHLIPRVLKPEKVLIIGPAENDYRYASGAAGAAAAWLCGSDGKRFLPDMQELESSAEHADMAFLANPNRITGMALADGMLSEMVSVFETKKCALVVDESFMDFIGGLGCIQKAAEGSGLIVMRTTSSFFGMPGLELAYAVSSAKTIAVLQKDQTGTLNILAIVAARAAMKDKPYRKMMSRFLNEEKLSLKRAVSGLPGISVYDSDTHVMLISFAGNADAVVRSAQQAGLAVESCRDIVGLDGTFFRISIMKHEQMVRLVKLLKAIAAREEKTSPESA